MAEMEINSTVENNNNVESSIKHYQSLITFSLHPETTLHMHVITNLCDEKESNSNEPERMIENIKSYISKNSNSNNNESYGERFAIMNSKRVVSVKHIAIAANIALMKHNKKQQHHQSNRRGIALQTIVHAAGSTHLGTVLRDYAFTSTNDHKYTPSSDDSNTVDSIIVLGFNCQSMEMYDCVYFHLLAIDLVLSCYLLIAIGILYPYL